MNFNVNVNFNFQLPYFIERQDFINLVNKHSEERNHEINALKDAIDKNGKLREKEREDFKALFLSKEEPRVGERKLSLIIKVKRMEKETKGVARQQVSSIQVPTLPLNEKEINQVVKTESIIPEGFRNDLFSIIKNLKTKQKKPYNIDLKEIPQLVDLLDNIIQVKGLPTLDDLLNQVMEEGINIPGVGARFYANLLDEILNKIKIE